MLRNNFLRWSIKIISGIAAFLIIFFAVQPFFVPTYLQDSTPVVKGYKYLEKNSIDALFLGSSQMFCSVDAGRLTDEYGISSYDFGASAQNMTQTEYYFSEALKTQDPKLVMLEVCNIFTADKDVHDNSLSWNFTPMKPSVAKFRTAMKVCDNNFYKSFKYSYAPILLYHSRWTVIGDFSFGEEKDFDVVLHPKKYALISSRGFFGRDHVEKHEIDFLKDDNNEKIIPEESRQAILNIAETCRENGAKLVLFKTPVSCWTKGDSLSVRKFADENGFDFYDFNENIGEIGIDENTDFYNIDHLNIQGAEKFTDYFVETLKKYL